MTFSASGKLLLTGEYSVLRGALALSIPTKFGQFLTVKKSPDKFCHWQSLDHENKLWFNAKLDDNLAIIDSSDAKIAAQLVNLLKAAVELNPDFTVADSAVKTTLNFNRNWGLGTSSTLVTLVAQWAKVDALTLFFKSFTGSGFDVATAMANSPILYTLENKKASYSTLDFNPSFSKNIYFIYLGKKQFSDVQVKKFASKNIDPTTIETISKITQEITACKTLFQFEKLVDTHEELTSKIIGQPTIKSSLFRDYPRSIKSLGAWGGDFILAVAEPINLAYFRQKGYKTILSWAEMVASN